MKEEDGACCVVRLAVLKHDIAQCYMTLHKSVLLTVETCATVPSPFLYALIPDLFMYLH